MKKLQLILAALLFVTISANAQEKGAFRAQVGGLIGTATAIQDDGDFGIGLGINLGAEYFVSDAVSIAPGYDLFFESSVDVGGTELSSNFSSINVDGRYYFGSSDVEIYGLVGVSFASSTTTVPLFGEVSANDTGLNIGAGVNFPMSDNVFLNGQVKYNTPIETIAIGVGLAFQF